MDQLEVLPRKRVESHDDGRVTVTDLAKRRASSQAAAAKRRALGVKAKPDRAGLSPEEIAEAIRGEARSAQIAANSMPATISISAARRARAKDARKRANASMREYRKATRETSVEVSSDDPERCKVPPTPLTKKRHRVGSLARMFERKEITRDMLQAADEIDAVYLALTKGLMAKGMQMEPRSPGGKVEMSDKLADAWSRRYRPWADVLSKRKKNGGPPWLEVVIDVLVDGRSVSEVDDDRGWRHGFAKYIVRRSLLEYAALAGWAPKDAAMRFDASQEYSLDERGFG